jgi:hypothetical protein
VTPDAHDAAAEGEKRFLPRWVTWLAIPAAVGPVAILGFVLVTERAHDSDACPFREVTRREVGPSLAVIEAARRCVADIEERRWTIVRDGRARVLGNRRLERDAFSSARYHWTAELSGDEVRVTVTNQGHGHVVFREGTPDERRRDGR